MFKIYFLVRLFLDTLVLSQIIENDVSADGLCTRREYARWFVKANSMLER